MSKLRSRFLRFIESRWSCYNTYDRNWRDIGNFSAVYLFASFNKYTKQQEIVYVGSTIDLATRYRVHKVPTKINAQQGCHAILYFKEMKKGFYDFERKLINRLQPRHNVQHKKT